MAVFVGDMPADSVDSHEFPDHQTIDSDYIVAGLVRCKRRAVALADMNSVDSIGLRLDIDPVAGPVGGSEHVSIGDAAVAAAAAAAVVVVATVAVAEVMELD